MRYSARFLIIPAILIVLAATGSAMASGPMGERAFQFKFGGFFPEGDSDFWAETEDVFTIDVGDFDGAMVGFTYLSPVSNNMEVGLNVDFYNETVLSAYRDYTDVDGFRIFHDTSLSMVPLSVDVRFLPAGRYGARGSRGQVMVRRPVFYLGGGIGVNFFEYEEVGDFVDFELDEVVFDRFRDSGAAFTAHALAGVELPVSPDLGLLIEGKYTWVDEELGSDFAGLGNLDLGGTSISVGLSYSF
ncbi:MAG: hypothetical protein IFK94_07175 [Acidobacteria bacterium]|uniref:Outer membrane protein beta-barrel domain-containing protein n=1 Tax=Candidatus Polarisedimenticola svalbardensis TaxID=2886004 RepID=A0A8J7CCS9_9BACT|nr:hypothetical protein [Candidatus Polarisedimenticola svalbardensis]